MTRNGVQTTQDWNVTDFRSVAAGVTMTVVPILIFFVVLQRQFVRGLGGALKG